MKRLVLPIAVACALLAWFARSQEPSEEAGRALFDGRSLAGWDGDSRFWSVENGAIVGRSTDANPCKDSTYLVWRGGEVADFELAFEFRIRGGNSGLQFRSRDLGRWKVAGYQADIEDGPSWTGCLYEQDGRGVIATRGERVLLGDGTREALRLEDAAVLQRLVREHDWNRCVVRASGVQIEISINGTRTVEVVDRDAARRRDSGVLALQLHAGGPMTAEFRDFKLVELARDAGAQVENAKPAATALERAAGPPQFDGAKPQWIWTSAQASESDVATFVRHFELRAAPKSAVLRGAADNQMRVFVNGKLALDNTEWWNSAEVDVSQLVHAGDNEVAICAQNDGGLAAAWAELTVTADRGRLLRLISDASWSAERLAPGETYEGWTPASFDSSRASAPHVFGEFGIDPWERLAPMMRGDPEPEDGDSERALAAEDLQIPDGFRAELLYSVPKSKQGSWVSMCEDPRGRLYVSDQYGGLFRITPAPLGGAASQTRVESVPVDIGSAHGLCWAFDSLYVVVSDASKMPCGLYRVRDTDGDGELDRVQLLREFDGDGEHGPHAVVLGPDNALWIVAGNFTKLPEPLDATRVPRTWQEDELLPHLGDPNGHDPHIMAPGGWVCRTDADGRRWELIASGMRNAYDIAFGPDGELFTFDSDMEWDIGAPWYRPTRVLHVVSGADFGWRNGSSKWPVTWPDTLPGVCDLGMTSPTGVVFGAGARFPPRYQRALFACDWAYGKIFAVHVEPRGSSFVGTAETFLEGKPFPVTDALIGRDGAMYITTGGRRTQSGLYRISWTRDLASDATVKASESALAATASARAERRAYEQTGLSPVDPTEARRLGAAASRGLASTDPFIRNASRVACERLDAKHWLGVGGDPHEPAALIALIHADPSRHRERVLELLGEVDLKTLDAQRLVDYLRVHQLVLLRCAPISETAVTAMRARISPLFPRGVDAVDRDLARLLAYLDVPAAIEPSLAKLASGATQEERIHFAHCLMGHKSGWSREQSKRYVVLLDALRDDARGGLSLAKFIDKIREHALEGLSAPDRAALEARDAVHASARGAAISASATFVRSWTKEALQPLLREPLAKRSFERGKAAYAKTRCAECHRIAGDGGATGPDLTGAGARFSKSDLLESLLEPSRVVSDQYRDIELLTKDGDLLVGRIEKEGGGSVTLRRLPPQEDLIELAQGEIESRRPHPLSRMPSGLLDVLSESDVLDLFAYVLSGANPDDASFAK